MLALEPHIQQQGLRSQAKKLHMLELAPRTKVRALHSQVQEVVVLLLHLDYLRQIRKRRRHIYPSSCDPPWSVWREFKKTGWVELKGGLKSVCRWLDCVEFEGETRSITLMCLLGQWLNFGASVLSTNPTLTNVLPTISITATIYHSISAIDAYQASGFGVSCLVTQRKCVHTIAQGTRASFCIQRPRYALTAKKFKLSNVKSLVYGAIIYITPPIL